MIGAATKKSWRNYRFDEFAENIAVRIDPAEADTNIYVGLEHLEPGTMHLRQWGHPSDVTGQKLVFKKGDVIFGRRRAYQRKLAVAPFDGICSAHAMVVRAMPKMILPEFLPFFLQSDMFMERAIEISVGSLSPTINWKTLRVQEFPLPPTEEQKRIAEILWAADDSIEKWSRTKKLLNVIETNLSLEFLNNKSMNSKKVKLGTYAEVISGQHIAANKHKNSPPGVPYLTGPADFPNGIIEGEKFTEHPKVICKEGDILLTCKGSGTGKSVVADKEYCISRQLMAIRPKGISAYLLQKIIFAMAEKFNREARGLIPGINRSDIIEKVVFIPTGSERSKIESRFLHIEESLTNIRNNIESLSKLNRSLINTLN